MLTKKISSSLLVLLLLSCSQKNREENFKSNRDTEIKKMEESLNSLKLDTNLFDLQREEKLYDSLKELNNNEFGDSLMKSIRR